ncbi:MAG: Stp1/IreP family PP2C-type Ser/Thr phosphatase [Clostridiales bacterium]|nr:MAG: Stp1/IreP family PP2C-type Ser/Thr phosphatase [Clostridiales bacterium]
MVLHGKSDIGKQRQQNQDCFIIRMLSDTTGYGIVCDGMGGHNGGNVASELAVRTLDNLLVSNFEDPATVNIEALLRSTVRTANGTVFLHSLKDETLKGMGTTVVMAYYMPERIYIANVGDSRAYFFDGERLTQVTRDHSLVQEMLDKNEITPEEAKRHPYKHVITRVLGVTSDVDVDIMTMDFGNEDVLLLCSDGLTNMLTDEEIEEVLAEFPYKDACDELVRLANEHGGQDNITVTLICGDNAV